MMRTLLIELCAPVCTNDNEDGDDGDDNHDHGDDNEHGALGRCWLDAEDALFAAAADGDRHDDGGCGSSPKARRSPNPDSTA